MKTPRGNGRIKASISDKVKQERGISGKDKAAGERDEEPAGDATEVSPEEIVVARAVLFGDTGPAPESQASLPLPAEPGSNGQPPKEITLKLVGPVVGLAHRAFSDRAELLEKLSKKNDEEGYPREGRIQKADALTIKEHLVRQLRVQLDLGVQQTTEVRAGIANALRHQVGLALNREFQAGRASAKDDQKGTSTSTRVDADVLLGTVAELVIRFAKGVADRAYAMGHVARTHSAETAMLDSLEEFSVGSARD